MFLLRYIENLDFFDVGLFSLISLEFDLCMCMCICDIYVCFVGRNEVVVSFIIGVKV